MSYVTYAPSCTILGDYVNKSNFSNHKLVLSSSGWRLLIKPDTNFGKNWRIFVDVWPRNEVHKDVEIE